MLIQEVDNREITASKKQVDDTLQEMATITAIGPLAVALYLLTTTSWTLGERLVLNRKYLPRT